MKAVVVCVVVAMAGSAAAQPGMTQPTQQMLPSAASSASSPVVMPREQPAQPAHVPGEISESRVVSISLGATFFSWATLAVGLAANNGTVALVGGVGTMITPSIGTWYAGGSSLPWMGMRLGGLVMMLWGVSNAVTEVDGCDFECTGGSSHTDTAVAVGLLGGLGLYVAGSIADIALAPSAARAHNRALRNLSIAPTVHPGGAGLVLGGRF